MKTDFKGVIIILTNEEEVKIIDKKLSNKVQALQIELCKFYEVLNGTPHEFYEEEVKSLSQALQEEESEIRFLIGEDMIFE